MNNITPENWYNQTFIKFELLKQLQYKYLSYMFKINEKWQLRRYYFGYNLEHINTAFSKITETGLKLHQLRFYSDLAYWQMQIFSWDVHKRKEQKAEWDAIKHDKITGYDLAFDFDGKKTWKDAHKHAKKLLNHFNNLNIPYSVCWSGSKGFHVKIRDCFMPKWQPLTKVKRSLEIAMHLKAKLKLPTLDIGIYDMDRILKLPYSIDSKTNLVVIPLTDEQFNNFNPEICTIENVAKTITIKNRGLLERQGNKINVKNMIAEIF